MNDLTTHAVCSTCGNLILAPHDSWVLMVTPQTPRVICEPCHDENWLPEGIYYGWPTRRRVLYEPIAWIEAGYGKWVSEFSRQEMIGELSNAWKHPV